MKDVSSFAEKKSLINLENKIKKLISKNDKKKASRLIEQSIENSVKFEDKEILRFILEPSGMTVAHRMALKGYTFKDPLILSLKGENRSDRNIIGHNGCAVAYFLAKKGFTFEEPSILKLGTEDGRSTVAHAMAEKGHKIKVKEILLLKDDQGISVAHVMARYGHKFDDEDILNLTTPFGFTVENIQKETHLETQ
jgi:hypothetical protein